MVARHTHQHEQLPLDRLASELGVHVRTLQAAARTGRLEVEFDRRSVWGRPRRDSLTGGSRPPPLVTDIESVNFEFVVGVDVMFVGRASISRILNGTSLHLEHRLWTDQD